MTKGQELSRPNWIETANAKINLGLKVLGRRPDGYHEIRTVMRTVDLADRLLFYRSSIRGLTCSDSTLDMGPNNLVSRAWQLFSEACSVPVFHIHLEKHIPRGAGLGGGSADAAAVLRALNRLCGEPCSRATLTHMAGELGSDVPFLVSGGTALACGRGDVLQPLRCGETFCYVLAWSGIKVGTAWAYARVEPDLTEKSAYLSFIGSISGGYVDSAELLSHLENDFQHLVERAYPTVARMRSYLDAGGALVSSMSGSGSAVYGIFDDWNAARDAQKGLQEMGHQSFFCCPSETSS